MNDENRTQPVTLPNEAKLIGRLATMLDKVPKSVQLRILGYLTSRVLEVGSWSGADLLYRAAALAREEEERKALDDG